MHGPIPGADPPGRAPSAAIAAIVASITPASAPRQPPWRGADDPASGSANSTGAQSAASTAEGDARTAVTIASARGLAARRHGRSTVTVAVPWIWWQVTSRSAERRAAPPQSHGSLRR